MANIENKQLNNLQAAQETIYSVVQNTEDNTIYIIDAVDNTIIPDLTQISLDIADLASGSTNNTGEITDAIDAAVLTIDAFTNTTADQVVVLLSDYIDASQLSVDSGITRQEGIDMVNLYTNTTAETLSGRMVLNLGNAVDELNLYTNTTAEQLYVLIHEKVDSLNGDVLDAISTSGGILSGEHTTLTTYINTTGEVVLTNMTDSLGELATAIADMFISMAGNTNDATADIKSDIADLDAVVDAGIITINAFTNTTGNQIVSLINAATADYASATDTFINESLEVVLTNLTEQLASPIIIDIDALQSSLGVPSDAALPAGLPYETSRDDCTWDVIAEVSRCFKCSTVGSVKTCQYCEHYINEAFTHAQCLADSGTDSQAYGACAMTIGTENPIDITTPFTSDEVAFVMNSALAIKHKGDIVASDTCISYPWVQPCNMHTLTAFQICSLTSSYGCQVPTTCTSSLSGMGCPSCTEA